MAGSYSTADYTTMKLGLSEWYRAMGQIGDTGADCAVLFFSGHGVSYGGGGQLLLPVDWPDPRYATAPNQAFQTAHIHEAVSALPVNHVSYFIDACWENGTSRIGQFRHTSEPPLPLPASAGLHNVNQLKPILYAANSGSITWQPTDPAAGLSYFGQALLEALRPDGTPVDETACTDGYCPVRFASLVPDVRRRMIAAITGIDPNLVPRVIDGGNGISDAKATWHRTPDRDPRDDDPGSPPGGPVLMTEEQRLSAHHESTWQPGDGYDELHRLTGHESITLPSMGIRFFDLEGGAPVEGDYLIHRVRHDETFNEVRYDLRVPDGAPGGRTWMMLTDPDYWDPAWACRLPLGDQALYQLYHLSSEFGGQPTIDVRFSDESPGVTGEVARRWIHSLDATSADGFGDDAVELVRVVAGKFRDEAALAAAEVAAAMLFRTNFEAVPTDWLRNLDSLGSIDGAVLLARRLMDERPDIAGTEIDEVLGNVRRFGLPTLQITTRILHLISDRFQAAGSPLSITNWIENTRARLQGSGLFAMYVGWVGDVGPWIAHSNAWSPDRVAELLEAYDFFVPPDGDPGSAGVPVPGVLHGEEPLVIRAYQSLSKQADAYGLIEVSNETQLSDRLGLDQAGLDTVVHRLNTWGLLDTVKGHDVIGYQLRNPVPTEWLGRQPEILPSTARADEAVIQH